MGNRLAREEWVSAAAAAAAAAAVVEVAVVEIC